MFSARARPGDDSNLPRPAGAGAGPRAASGPTRRLPARRRGDGGAGPGQVVDPLGRRRVRNRRGGTSTCPSATPIRSATTTVDYDADDLFVSWSADALGNDTRAGGLRPPRARTARLDDANGNRSEVAYDIRGLPVATRDGQAVRPGGGRDLSGVASPWSLNPPGAVLAFFLDASPTATRPAAGSAGDDAVRLPLRRADRRSGPSRSGTLQPPARAASCGSGIARRAQRRTRRPDAAPSSTPTAPAALFVTKVQAEPDPADPAKALSWIANGKTIVNNKGNPVLQYEYYSPTAGTASRSRTPSASRRSSTTTRSAGRSHGLPGRVGHPRGVVARGWSRSHDRNDTVLDPRNRWYAEHTAAGATTEDKRAARLARLGTARRHADGNASGRARAPGRRRGAGRSPDAASAPVGATSVADRPWKEE